MAIYEQTTIFPHLIDNSMLKALRTCPHKALRGRLQGLQPKRDASIDLHFGKAFASGIEAGRRIFYEQHQSQKVAQGHGIAFAIEAYQENLPPIPARSNKTLDRLVACMRAYWLAFPLGEDGLTPIPGGIEHEFKFLLPFFHPVDNQPMYYGGKCDMLATDSVGRLVVVDEKTAGANLSDAWMMQWTMDPQMTGYIAALQVDGRPLRALIRGISTGVSISTVEVDVFRTQHQLDQWHAQMLREVERMFTLYADGHWDRMFGNACVEYGRPCEYQPLCTSPNTQQLITENYTVAFWSPHSDTPKPLSTPATDGGTTLGVSKDDY